MRQDDAVGPYIVEILKKETKDNNINFIDCDVRPENFIDDIKEYNPEEVFVIDAADFGGKPGEVKIISVEEIDNYTVSTHTIPLSLFVYLLEKENIKVTIIGIQKKGINFNEPISSEIMEAMDEIKKKIKQICGIIIDGG